MARAAALALALAALATHAFHPEPRFLRPRAARKAPPLQASAGAASSPQQNKALSLGAPRGRPKSAQYTTAGGIGVTLAVNGIQDPQTTVERLIDALDARKGALFASSYEFPGRYARWTLGFVNPPLEIAGRDRSFTVRALNERGQLLLEPIAEALHSDPHVDRVETDTATGTIQGSVIVSDEYFPEEERSKQPSLFSVVRRITDLFGYPGDPQLGLYGSFGYDLTFQFEPIELVHDRPKDQRDLLLYLPDQIIVVDEKGSEAWELRYDFEWKGNSTSWVSRSGDENPFQPLSPERAKALVRRDTPEGAFSGKVHRAKEEFKVGNLFEAVLSQTFTEPCTAPPSQLFRRLRRRNPAPYGFLINLGAQEYLVGASPEMFVRCEQTEEGLRVETCPISGTIARGADALEDAQRIKTILANPKEESELTMCTDVDRNDKSRICVPGSVRVLGRRQIEMYSRLIHTVDHVEGYLRKGFDALDAFLCHTWAVTVTGAPKTWAIQFVERQEESPRQWYGGAVGIVGFDGHLNTGLTLRTVHVKHGAANVRAGATLLFDSEPEAEERETELKASAMLDAVTRGDILATDEEAAPPLDASGQDGGLSSHSSEDQSPRVLLIDHQDSFVHTLANYLRQTGAEVVTARSGTPALTILDDAAANAGDDATWTPDLVVLSPGPGNPQDFGLSETLAKIVEHQIPAFGVCLGLQGIVEHFGGELGILDYPMHGKPSEVMLIDPDESGYNIFTGLPQSFEVARYHSLHGIASKLPPDLRITALTEDGIVMAIEHKNLPIAAVQFHPESILTNPSHGLTILSNCLNVLRYEAAAKAASTST